MDPLSSSELSSREPSATCVTCVAVAIVQRHRDCLRALLSHGPLRSQHFWLPAIHLMSQTELTSRPVGIRIQPVETLLSSWPCRCTTLSAQNSSQNPPVSRSAQIFLSRADDENLWRQVEQLRLSTETVDKSCDHLLSAEPEKDGRLAENPVQTAFLAVSLISLALESPDAEIRRLFVEGTEFDYN